MYMLLLFVNVLCEFHVDFDSNRIGTLSLVIWYINTLSFTIFRFKIV